jgi:hypothetical protein
MCYKETARFYGEGLHPRALKSHLYRHVQPVVAQLRSEVEPRGDAGSQGRRNSNGLLFHFCTFFF